MILSSGCTISNHAAHLRTNARPRRKPGSIVDHEGLQLGTPDCRKNVPHVRESGFGYGVFTMGVFSRL